MGNFVLRLAAEPPPLLPRPHASVPAQPAPPSMHVSAQSPHARKSWPPRSARPLNTWKDRLISGGIALLCVCSSLYYGDAGRAFHALLLALFFLFRPL